MRRWAALLLFMSCSAGAQGGLTVDKPFLSETARKNFAACYPDVSPEDLQKLRNIVFYGYKEFPAATDCTTPGCNPKLKEFTSTRIIAFDAGQLNSQGVKEAVYGVVGGDCSYNRVEWFNYSVDLKQIAYRYRLYHKERSCNYGIVFDKGDAAATFENLVTLQPDFSVSQSSRKFDVSEHNNFSVGNAFADSLIGGMIAGPVGSFVGAVGIANVNAVLFGSDVSIGTAKFDVDFGKSGINLYAYSKVQKQLDKLGQTTPLRPYSSIEAQSGFVNAGDQISVQVLQGTQVLDIVREDFVATRRIEIEFLSSLNEVSAKKYVVKKGDNIWKIVRSEYGDARLHLLVADLNGVGLKGRLFVGRELELPRWHQLCKELGGNPLSVKQGESLWSKASSNQLPKDFRKVKTHSGKPSLIYPLEVLQVK